MNLLKIRNYNIVIISNEINDLIYTVSDEFSLFASCFNYILKNSPLENHPCRNFAGSKYLPYFYFCLFLWANKTL